MNEQSLVAVMAEDLTCANLAAEVLQTPEAEYAATALALQVSMMRRSD